MDRKERGIFELMMGWEEEVSKETTYRIKGVSNEHNRRQFNISNL